MKVSLMMLFLSSQKLGVLNFFLRAVSMIDGRLFDKLEFIARGVRNPMLPFGGIQLVICGDFFQLPPVPDYVGDGRKAVMTFAFEAHTWQSCIPTTIQLTKVFRQKDNGESIVYFFPMVLNHHNE